MRLICPNCGAQYEVDDEAIPETGRDVQCSNCGHGWFQVAPATDAALADELGLQAALSEDEAEDIDLDADEDDVLGSVIGSLSAEVGQSDKPIPAPGAVKRELDDGVRDILREEAEREMKAREEERGKLEVQTELGLDDGETPDSHRRAARERMERLRHTHDDEDEDAPAREESPPRRGSLPDIDEINSSLDAGAPQAKDQETAPAAKAEKARRGGFRRGFVTMMVLMCLIVALYVYAPLIAQRYPQAEPFMALYVETIDKLRIWLDQIVRIAIAKMEALTAGKGA